MSMIYLDYASTTPTDPRVQKAMRPFFGRNDGLFGNPNSLHQYGETAYGAMEQARAKLAGMFGASSENITFTGSATEASNLFIRGTLKAYFNLPNHKEVPHAVVSSIEHASILSTVRALEKDGALKVSYIPPEKNGVVSAKNVANALEDNTIFVSLMWVNNELGTIQPISEVARLVTEFRAAKQGGVHPRYPLMHTDAVQAFAWYDVKPIAKLVDAMSVSAHKIYGPKGIGALYHASHWVDEQLAEPIITGGGQEGGLRSGTQNVASIVGFAHAAQLCAQMRENENTRIQELGKYFLERLTKAVPEVSVNGSLKQKAPHIIHINVPMVDNVALSLDVAGIAVSAGSACAARKQKHSHVTEAIGLDNAQKRNYIRISLGRYTTKREIDKAVKTMISIIGH